jgi:microsomal dipeptidase-like Zn-dependent dipeptidase
MNSESTIRAFQTAIINAANHKLNRVLTDQELRFIESRGGFVALEMIFDTVKSASTSEELEKYLNSEA